MTDQIDEQAVRGRLQFLYVMDGSQHAADTLALLDAKDAEIARLNDCLEFQSSSSASNAKLADSARAKVAKLQEAIGEAYDLLHDHKASMAAAKLFPHLPKPAPDPLVEAMQEAAEIAAKSFGVKLDAYVVEQEAADTLRKCLAARGLTIAEAARSVKGEG